MTKKITELTNEDPVTVSETFRNYLAEIDTKEANKDGTPLNQDLDEVLENEWHLTGEAKFRAKELFHQAVRNNSTRLQDRTKTLASSPCANCCCVIEGFPFVAL